MSDVEFVDNSEKVLSEFDKAVLKALTSIGIEAERYAKAQCPVDTGRLRNSISNEVKDSEVYIGTNVEYAEQVEYGDQIKHTTGNAHFLRNAATQHSDEYRKIVEQELKSPHD